MKPIWTIGKRLVFPGLAMLLLLTACSGATRPPEPLFFDIGAWDPGIRTIALVEVTFDRRYMPPTDYDLERDMRIFLRRELERKGYRMVVADQGNDIFTENRPSHQLAALIPAGADAALTIHVDYLFFSETLGERNPPPEAEIAAEARLTIKDPARELWRDWADATAGGDADFPYASLLFLRQEALQELAEMLFDTLPDAGEKASNE